MDHTPTLLVADEEGSLRARLTRQLEADELPCRQADSLAGTRAALETGTIRLALLGHLDDRAAALRLVRALRGGELRCNPGLPAILFGQASDELELLRAFDAGCDDFVARDVGYLELRARVRVYLPHRRTRPSRPTPGRHPRHRPRHPPRQPRRAGGRAVRLTAMEFALLDRLAGDPERVFTKQELLRDVWGDRR